MDFMKIGAALLLLVMLVVLFPRVRHMIKNSPEGSRDDWMNAVIPIIAVAGFIYLLMQLV